ncbi:MAG: CPBP family intramembrane metalloprotease [Candidatus Hydrogenedentota bacterium]|nr:MAG: CPBP family intramembrane metalloprotease [Candidatus Hydrogenedentota bacterium]
MNPEPSERFLLLRFALLTEGFLFVLGALLAWYLAIPLRSLFHADTDAVLLGFAGTLPLVLALAIEYRYPGPLRETLESIEEFLLPVIQAAALWELLFVSLLAGVCEEFFFRGVMQSGFTQYNGVVAGIILSSLAFGAAHLVTPGYGLAAALLGTWLGACFHFTGNLLVPILQHALYDFIALLVLRRRGPRFPETPLGFTAEDST